MTDRITLHGMRFEGRHGVGDEERSEPQPIEMDVELWLDLREAGATDDLARTADYSIAFERCRRVVEEQSFRLIEGIADAAAHDLLEALPVDEVVVRVRKPAVPIEGLVEHAQVEIRRARER